MGIWFHHSDPHGAPGQHGPPHDGAPTLNDARPWVLTTGNGITVNVQVISWAPVLDGDGRLVMAVARFSGSDANGVDCGGLGWLRYRQR